MQLERLPFSMLRGPSNARRAKTVPSLGFDGEDVGDRVETENKSVISVYLHALYLSIYLSIYLSVCRIQQRDSERERERERDTWDPFLDPKP